MLKNWIEQIVRNPNLYVALVVSALLGGGSGGVIGCFAGAFIGDSLSFCSNYNGCVFNLNPAMVIGALLGFNAGVLVGSAITIAITLFKIYKKTKNHPMISSDSIIQVLSASFWINLEIVIGMVLGAIIGSLQSRGMGTLIGAVIGLFIIWLTSTLNPAKKEKK